MLALGLYCCRGLMTSAVICSLCHLIFAPLALFASCYFSLFAFSLFAFSLFAFSLFAFSHFAFSLFAFSLSDTAQGRLTPVDVLPAL